MNLLKKIQVHKKQYGTSGTVVRIFHFAFRQIGFVWETFYYMEKVLTSGILEVKNNTGYIIRKLTFDDFLKGDGKRNRLQRSWQRQLTWSKASDG